MLASSSYQVCLSKMNDVLHLALNNLGGRPNYHNVQCNPLRAMSGFSLGMNKTVPCISHNYASISCVVVFLSKYPITMVYCHNSYTAPPRNAVPLTALQRPEISYPVGRNPTINFLITSRQSSPLTLSVQIRISSSAPSVSTSSIACCRLFKLGNLMKKTKIFTMTNTAIAEMNVRRKLRAYALMTEDR
jgi:hypothetical protein